MIPGNKATNQSPPLRYNTSLRGILGINITDEMRRQRRNPIHIFFSKCTKYIAHAENRKLERTFTSFEFIIKSDLLPFAVFFFLKRFVSNLNYIFHFWISGNVGARVRNNSVCDNCSHGQYSQAMHCRSTSMLRWI